MSGFLKMEQMTFFGHSDGKRENGTLQKFNDKTLVKISIWKVDIISFLSLFFLVWLGWLVLGQRRRGLPILPKFEIEIEGDKPHIKPTLASRH